MMSLQTGPQSLRRMLLISFALLALGASQAHAQTNAVASKSADISLFAGYQNLHPDYAFNRDNGFIIGADITKYLRGKIDPSLEVRYNYTPGPYVSEKSFEAGVRAQSDFRRFHPYVDFLGGVATVNFAKAYGRPTYTNNSGFTFSVGGGADIDIYRNLQLKIDYQQQYMYFDQNITLTPRPASVGLAYRIPFRPRIRN